MCVTWNLYFGPLWLNSEPKGATFCPGAQGSDVTTSPAIASGLSPLRCAHCSDVAPRFFS